jgi:hypothetical protein
MVAPMRAATFAAVCLPIRRRLVRWADDAREQIASVEPTFPTGLRDRAQDNWSALLTIAQLAGPMWLERGHQSALILSGGEESNDDSPAVQLLEDSRAIYDDIGGEVVASAKLVELLNALDGRPYSDRQGGKGVTSAWLAKQLKTFGIKPAGTVRLGAKTAKGYRWSAFEDSWARFLPPRSQCDGSDLLCDTRCDGSEPQNRPINTEVCYGVTAVTAVQGKGEGVLDDGLF